MKQTSEQYKLEMMNPFRGRWLLNVYIGFIKELFQKSAEVKEISKLSFLSHNCNNYLFNNIMYDEKIATFEKDLFMANGETVFMDKAHTNTTIQYYGLISETTSDVDNNINFHVGFKSKNKIKGIGGLTLYFMDTYPTLLTITVKGGGETLFTKTYTNDSYVFETTDNFSNEGEELIIHVQKMNKPYVRLRMYYVLFGVGVNFQNDDILVTGGMYSSFMHPRSIELPSQTLDISIDNYTDRFDFDKPGSLINLMNTGQDISLQIGYMKESGEIEYLKKETMELSSFDMEQGILNINAVDFLRNENNNIEFDDPSFFKSSTTLYEVAQEVIKKLKNPSFKIIIDDSLRSVPIKFHQIKTTVKEALLMIASASRCIMEFTEEGLHIRRKEIKYVELKSRAMGSASWADNIVTNNTPITVYATFEKDKIKADGTNPILPNPIPKRTNSSRVITEVEFPELKKTGYVSEVISDNNGNIFNDTEYLIIQSKEAISPSRLLIYFTDITVESVRITTYYNNNRIEYINFTDVNSDVLDTLYDFKAFNRIEIQVTKLKEAYRRVYIQYVAFDEYVYNIQSDLVLESLPKGALLDTVRDIYVNYTYSALDEDGRLDIENQIVIHCNDNGSDIEYDNPFITTESVARQVGEWLKDYYIQQIEYDFEWCGDPSVEVNDLVLIPNNYVEGVICDIETNNIIFSNGSLRGNIVARRKADAMDRAKNRLDNKRLY